MWSFRLPMKASPVSLFRRDTTAHEALPSYVRLRAS